MKCFQAGHRTWFMVHGLQQKALPPPECCVDADRDLFRRLSDGDAVPNHSPNLLRTLPMLSTASTTVYFDGSCPLCRREISIYQRAIRSRPIDWVDVSATAESEIAGRSCGDLMTRFHVRTPNGDMLSGAAAFVALWLMFPGWRWLGRFGSLPGMCAVLEVLYRGFLKVRPLLQRMVKRFDARST